MIKINNIAQLICLSYVALTFSCSSKQNQVDATTAQSYSLEIVDSVMVDVMATYPSLFDIHSETGEILMAQTDPLTVWILSPEGEVLKEWSKSGDGPDEIGKNFLSAEFYEDGIALMGYMTVKTFDKDFNLKNIYKADFSSSGMIYVGFNHLFEFKADGKAQLVSYMGGPQTETPSIQKEYYKEFNIVDVLSPNDFKETNPNTSLNAEGSKPTTTKFYEPVGKLPPNSRYFNDKAYYFMKPEFDVKEDKLYYAINDDTTLNILDLPSRDLISSYGIPFDEFILFEGYSLGTKGYAERNEPRDWEGKIEKLFDVGDKEAFFYTSGIKLSKLSEIKDDPDFRAETRRINYVKNLIVKDGKRINTELKMNSKYRVPSIADEDGFLWAAQNLNELEEEPDMVTLYKLQIVPDKEN